VERYSAAAAERMNVRSTVIAEMLTEAGTWWLCNCFSSAQFKTIIIHIERASETSRKQFEAGRKLFCVSGGRLEKQ
jgi:hypothetical protein